MPWADKVASILEVWYPGTEGGAVIARLLSGAVNPSGHLPLTIAKTKEQLAHPHPPKAGRVVYEEGATVGYKWFDKRGFEPLFAFGHGLSYTSFVHEELQASIENNRVLVQFIVRNTGTIAGKDVSQIYLARPGWEAPQRLGAFRKVDLKPGETKAVSLEIDPRLLATWDLKSRAWKITAGPVEVRLASSSRDIIRATQLVLAAEQITTAELSATAIEK
jgi:beta-glucosidase